MSTDYDVDSRSPAPIAGSPNGGVDEVLVLADGSDCGGTIVVVVSLHSFHRKRESHTADCLILVTTRRVSVHLLLPRYKRSAGVTAIAGQTATAV